MEAPAGTPPDDEDRGELPQAERDALATRQARIAAAKPGAAPGDEPRWGLALSGGGIRSATFCLGLIRALAGNGVLRHFDYLSTVSGGGYAGAALGRLYRAGHAVDALEKRLASEGTLFLWWLRSNGRYLIPKGRRDLLQAAASQLRGFLATQFEVAMLLMLFGCLVVLPHLIVDVSEAPFVVREWGRMNGAAWWALLPLPAFAAGTSIFAYWFSREDCHGDSSGFLCRFNPGDLAFSLLAVVAAILIVAGIVRGHPAVDSGAAPFPFLPLALAFALGSVGAGYALRLCRIRREAAADRLAYTAWLAWSLGGGLGLVGIGLLDSLSWGLAWLWSQRNSLVLPGVGGGLGALLALARVLLPQWQKAKTLRISGALLDRLANLAGLLVLALLAVLWVAVVQNLVFLHGMDAPQAEGASVAAQLKASPLFRWAALFNVLALYQVFSWRNLDQLNRSSLYAFYRSRLARTYVSVGNFREGSAKRTGRFPEWPLTLNDRMLTHETARVTRLIEGDDAPLAQYRPFEAGGPIHLVNCCINQTRDDRTGSFNADRKGLCLTVSALGLETGTHWPKWNPALVGTTLSQWIAISGAAVSSGMGSMTRPGISALLYLSGLRLGYWWQRSSRRPFFKPLAILAEMLASFPGLRSRAWYVSDGGHFDNTGVYALLKRRLALIVLADCGADPHCLFGDLENLVRKARIDYGAEIEFIDPEHLPADWRAHFGTPESILPEAGDACLMLARIRYFDGSLGSLLVVKPRRLKQMPLDVAAYADRDPLFPQQTTADQFFDEAQWEAYHCLGRLLGARIDAGLLAGLRTLAETSPARPLAGVMPRPATVSQVAARRTRVANAVGASVGIGTVLSLLLGGWAAWHAESRRELDQARLLRQSLIEESRLLSSEETLVRFSQGIFPREIRTGLDVLFSLGAGKSGRLDAGMKRSLDNLSVVLASLCGSDLSAGDAATCKLYVSLLRREVREDGLLDRMIARYWGSDAGKTGALPPANASEAPLPPAAPLSRRIASKCQLPEGGGRVLAIRIHDETARPRASEVADLALKAGLAVQGIENVADTARRQKRLPPPEWERPTLIYRGDDSAECAASLQRLLQRRLSALVPQGTVRIAMPASLDDAPDLIELWLPTGNGRP